MSRHRRHDHNVTELRWWISHLRDQAYLDADGVLAAGRLDVAMQMQELLPEAEEPVRGEWEAGDPLRRADDGQAA